MSGAAAAALALHVVLAAGAELRLASSGTGDARVVWTIGGREVAWTDDAHAATLALPPGQHVLWASTAWEGSWRVLARSDAPGQGEAQFVPAWTAADAGTATARPLLATGLLLLAAAVALGRSLLEGARRRGGA